MKHKLLQAWTCGRPPKHMLWWSPSFGNG